MIHTGADVDAAMIFTDQVLAMVDDPDLHSDRLLLAIGLAAELEHRRRAGRSPQARMDRKRNIWAVVRDHVVNRDHPWAGHADHWLRKTISDDVPRYEMADRSAIPCCGHMLRPPGAPCKKPGRAVSTSIPDPMTGERTLLGACSDPRHKAEFEHIRKTAGDAWRAAGEPQPAFNAGGILRRYFRAGWDEIYDWARPSRDRRDAAGKPPTPPRPRLTLVPRPTDPGDDE